MTPMENKKEVKKAIVLVSGGLDSCVALATALSLGFEVEALNCHYGQRHAREMRSALEVARFYGVRLHEADVKLPFLASADSTLTNPTMTPTTFNPAAKGVANSYVPLRNSIMLSIAASLAESKGACDIFYGANVLDYSGYPDCRPEFIEVMAKALTLGSKHTYNGTSMSIHAPLVKMSKADIIKEGLRLGAPLHLTWSCYRGGERPCGECDSCGYRAKGFAEVGVRDPALT